MFVLSLTSCFRRADWLIQTGKDEYDSSKSEDETKPNAAGSVFQNLRADLDG